jgi:ATP-dependent Clp protease ATP-binding subunit ClpA
MIERYTEAARRAIFFARDEAGQAGSPFIAPEHLLLGLFRADRDLAPHVLGTVEAADSIRSEIVASYTPGERLPDNIGMPVSPVCAHALLSAAEEADQLGHKNITPGHLILGLLREEGCLAAQLLRSSGLSLAGARAKARDELDAPAPKITLAGLLDRFTEPTRHSIRLAQDAAGRSGSHSIAPEHLLLGLFEADIELARRMLGTAETADSIRNKIIPPGTPAEPSPAKFHLPLDQPCAQALWFAAEEADQLGHKNITPGHLILGLLREETCLAAQLLTTMGLTLPRARAIVQGDFMPPPA